MSATAVHLDQVPAYQQPFEEVLAALGTDARQGLSEDEARARPKRPKSSTSTPSFPW
jgi:hypothetical protein